MKIIVPTDFSPTSYNALKVAKEIAKKTKGEIVLLHVIEEPSISMSSIGEILEDKMENLYIKRLLEKTEESLQSLKEEHDDVNIKIMRKIGDPYNEIKDLIAHEQADIVVIGEKGTTDVNDFFIGSLTDKIVRLSNCAVITVNQFMENHTIENILYATDLREEHPKLVALIIQLQLIFDAKLHIVKINTKNKFTNDIDTMVDLRQFVDKYEIDNYTIDTYNHEDEEYGVIYYADQVKADLIAMGMHKRTGVRRLINGGDLVIEVAAHSHRPVLTYHFNAK